MGRCKDCNQLCTSCKYCTSCTSCTSCSICTSCINCTSCIICTECAIFTQLYRCCTHQELYSTPFSMSTSSCHPQYSIMIYDAYPLTFLLIKLNKHLWI